jgi:hypothetical protein
MEKVICQDCKGNGYIKTLFEEGREWIITDCDKCKNQGEINMIDKERLESILNKSNTSLNTERLILDSKLVKELNGIIKKLNDEVDMLSKQKVYLQSKLKEKEKNDTRR